MTDHRAPLAVREVAAVLVVQATLLLAMAPFYGPHRAMTRSQYDPTVPLPAPSGGEPGPISMA